MENHIVYNYYAQTTHNSYHSEAEHGEAEQDIIAEPVQELADTLTDLEEWIIIKIKEKEPLKRGRGVWGV